MTCLLIHFPFSLYEDKININNCSIVYDNNSFWLCFDEFDFAYERIFIYLNDVLLKAYENNQMIDKVELFNSLLKENNKIELEVITGSIKKTAQLFFKLENRVNITDSGYFSFNNLISEKSDFINFGVDQFLIFRNFVCEFNTINYKYLDLSIIGTIEYDHNYPLCEEIELYIFNYHEIGLKNNIFKLEKKNDRLAFINNYKWDSTLINNGKLYLPKNMHSQLIEIEITLKSIYLSSIDLSFNCYINIESSLKDNFKINLAEKIIDNYEVVYNL